MFPSHSSPLRRCYSRSQRSAYLAVPLTRSLGLLSCLLAFFFATAVFNSALDRFGEEDDQILPGGNARPDGQRALKITIFSGPWPSSEAASARQELAVRSWLTLSQDVNVVLFGTHPSIFALAESLGNRVTVETAVDFSFAGNPFFHSMIARAQASDSGICILIDPETILHPEIITSLTYLSKLNRDWFLISMSHNVSNFPYQLADSGKHWVQADGKEIDFNKLQDLPADRWAAGNCDKGLLVAWNNPGLPLHAGVLPPFLYGKGLHNCWLTNEVLSSEMRLVFDASNLVHRLFPESFSVWHNKLSMENTSGPIRTWEYNVNYHLAALYGSYYYQPSRHPHTLYKVVKHSGHYLLSKVEKSVKSTLANSWIEKKRKFLLDEGSLWSKEKLCSSEELHNYSFEISAPIYLPYSLEMLLQLVADKDKSVILGVAGASYRDMLMSWVCRLRHLGVTNFIVCALDPETYEFSVLQGLPVFKDPSSPKNVSFDDCHFGTECFQRVTKVKSRIVLEILKLGYNVLLSDVDIYWFRNPLPFLHSLGPAIFGAQSDEYNETGPINLPRRLNSGFYFARSDDATIMAMEMIVKHATNSGLSEQPSFYDVLCGEGGVNRNDDDQCLEPETNLTVFFLDRNFFPNGAYKGLWEKRDVRSACKKLGCFILHNNWINGRKRKLQRQISSGLWDYDPSTRLCLQIWSATSSLRMMDRFQLFEDADS